MKYEDITIEECFIKYNTNNIACECNADDKKIYFYEDITILEE